jgi:pSer/pThr/pTyr-binding forkhead associated (FHA) protein
VTGTSSAPPPAARLVWERADGTRSEFALGAQPLLVGRDEQADIRIDEPLVSREHARIEWQGDSFVVIDLASTNFTRLNGEKVMRARLEHGDELRFGRAVSRVLLEVTQPA